MTCLGLDTEVYMSQHTHIHVSCTHTQAHTPHKSIHTDTPHTPPASFKLVSSPVLCLSILPSITANNASHGHSLESKRLSSLDLRNSPGLAIPRRSTLAATS